MISKLALVLAVGALVALPGCQSPQRKEAEASQSSWKVIDASVYHRAESGRAERLEREVERLRADLRAAEEALLQAESGMRGSHSRADAVSALAEVRIQVERASRSVPWQRSSIEEARSKLDEADDLIRDGHFSAGLFFVNRARRIAELLKTEAEQVRGEPAAFFVRRARVNLRSGPATSESVIAVLKAGTPVFVEYSRPEWALVRTTSASVGWIHRSLLSEDYDSLPASLRD